MMSEQKRPPPGNVGGRVQEVMLRPLAVQADREKVAVELFHHGLEIIVGQELEEPM